MRLYPPAWGLGREAIADCEVGGYHVPRGTQVLTIQWVVHRDPRWFEEPEAFWPERWADDLERRLPRCAYFPFGDGPRICVGQQFALTEAVLVLATVARRYRLTLVSDEPLELVASITMRRDEGSRCGSRAGRRRGIMPGRDRGEPNRHEAVRSAPTPTPYPATMVLPSGLKAALKTSPSLTTSGSSASRWRPAASHTTTPPSPPSPYPAAMVLPSG